MSSSGSFIPERNETSVSLLKRISQSYNEPNAVPQVVYTST